MTGGQDWAAETCHEVLEIAPDARTITVRPYRPTFEDILGELQSMQERKGKDYGTETDSLANLLASEAFGIPAWVGAILRGNDKMRRIQSFVVKGRLENESIEDALLDLAVYAIHSLRLYREKFHNTAT